MRRIIFICAACLFLLMVALFAIEYAKDSPRTILGNVSTGVTQAAPVSREGERLTYIVKYLWILPIATAEIEVGQKDYYKNHRIYPLSAKGRVSDFISRFIKAHGEIKSYVDVGKLHPWRYEERSQAEGHSPSNKTILYDQDRQIMEFENIKRKIPPNTQDPLSAFFYLRHQQYEMGRETEFNVNSNKENYTLSAKLLKRQVIGFKEGEKKILVIESQIKSPKEFSKSEARITTYVTDDERRVPILLKIRTKFGPLTVRLIGRK